MPRDQRLLAEVLQAIRENKLNDVKQIVETRIRRRERGSGFPFSCGGDNEITLPREYESVILAASRLKDTAILKYLIDNGANTNCVGDSPQKSDESSVSPLHVAVGSGLHDTVALLLGSNADVDKLDHKGRTPLHLAVKKADCQLARMLLFRGCSAHINDQNGFTPLQLATRYGHVELVRILLEHDANVFQPGQKGPSPLHIAAMEGHVPLIDLFSRYVDINIKVPCTATDARARAPLHLASERGLVETVRFMVERFGADVNVLDSDAQTPLHSALQRPHDFRRMRKKEDFDTMSEFFLKKGQDLNQQDCRGNTVLHYGAQHQYHRIVECLLMSGADQNTKNKDARTAQELVPDFDIPMKQLFVKYMPFSSTYITSATMSGTPQHPPGSPIPAASPPGLKRLTAVPVTNQALVAENDHLGCITRRTTLSTVTHHC